MAAYTVTEQAQQDIENIVVYIAEDNITAALSVENDLYEAFQLLADNPKIGFLRPEWTEKPYRFKTVRKHYIIAYKPEAVPIEIMKVVNGHMDVKAVFND
jgi:plasmid stabilization system protein ParE